MRGIWSSQSKAVSSQQAQNNSCGRWTVLRHCRHSRQPKTSHTGKHGGRKAPEIQSHRPLKQYQKHPIGGKDQESAEWQVVLERSCTYRAWEGRTMKADLQQKPNVRQPETHSRVSAPFLSCCCAKTPKPRKYEPQYSDAAATGKRRHEALMMLTNEGHELYHRRGKLV